MENNRRNFLKMAGFTALGCGLAQAMPKPIFGAATRMSAAAQAATGKQTLVVVYLGGGNDGINTVVPLNEYDLYASRRATVRLDRDSQILPLASAPDFGLNYGMTMIRDLFDQGRVAIIPGVGVPKDSVSKFDHAAGTYDFVSADPYHRSYSERRTGWVGRFVETTPAGQVTPAVDFGGGALLLKGYQLRPLSIGRVTDFQLRVRGNTTAARVGYAEMMGIVRRESEPALAKQVTSSDALRSSLIVQEKTANYQPAPGIVYPTDSLGTQMRQVAAMIKADLGVRAYSVSIGGFDTHSNQNISNNGALPFHVNLLKRVSDGIATLYNDLKAQNLSEDVVILTISEFGRRVAQNNDNGTDHGTSSVSFVVGDKVKGGVFGHYPSLNSSKLILGNNLDITTDYRTVYATILANFFDVDPMPTIGMASTLEFL